MKKLIFLFTILFLLNGCSNDENPQNQEQESVNLKSITVNVQLPNNSNTSSNDLTVSSLFTANSGINDNTAIIETFNDESMELTFATNSEGNIVMLSYFNPISTDMVEMNSETTAIALILLHPWTFDLSTDAKSQAITYITNLSEFETYKNTVENSISSGNLNPLNTQEVIDIVTQIQQITFNRTTEYIEPLQFNVEGNTASVKNLISSASYSIGLYEENDLLIEHKLAEGLDKSHFLFQEFQNAIFQETESDSQTATFNIPTDGDWTLKAKSGLSFDGTLENQQAAFYNTKTVVANVIGIFSTKLKTLIKKGECFISLGQNVYNGISDSINIQESLMAYDNGSKSGYSLTKDILYYVSDRFQSIKDIIESCASETTDLSALENLQSGFFGQIFGFINIVSSAENVFNSTAMLTDWIQFDKEIEYCFNKNGNEIQDCGIDLSGNWTINESNCLDLALIVSFNSDNSFNIQNSSYYQPDTYTLDGNNLTINISYQDSDFCSATNSNSQVDGSIAINVTYNNDSDNFGGSLNDSWVITPSCSGDNGGNCQNNLTVDRN